MPSIIQFLEYNPLPAATTLAERLVRHRTTLGMSQKEAAREIGVGQGTLARWEGGTGTDGSPHRWGAPVSRWW